MSCSPMNAMPASTQGLTCIGCLKRCCHTLKAPCILQIDPQVCSPVITMMRQDGVTRNLIRLHPDRRKLLEDCAGEQRQPDWHKVVDAHDIMRPRAQTQAEPCNSVGYRHTCLTKCSRRQCLSGTAQHGADPVLFGARGAWCRRGTCSGLMHCQSRLQQQLAAGLNDTNTESKS